MKLLYGNEHLTCGNYSGTDVVPLFQVKSVKKGEKLRRRDLDETLIVLLVKGRIMLDSGTSMHHEVTEGSMFLLPKMFDVRGEVEEDSLYVTCLFSIDMRLCNRFSLEHLKHFCVPGKMAYDFALLPFTDVLARFVCLLVDCLKAGLGCIHFHRLKREELFLYFRAFYSNEQLAAFFYPIIGADIDFKDFVISHYREVKDVKEFAGRVNMSVSTFNRRFRQEFGMSAHKWLVRRKSESVLNDILMSNLTFAEISLKYNFSSPSYLVSFCRRMYGKAPNELRARRDAGTDE